jgi:hypothetical protein
MAEPTATDFREVTVADLSRRDWVTLGWGMTWRGMVILVASCCVSGAAGFVLGGIVGVVIVALGAQLSQFILPLRCLGGIIGLFIGFWFFTTGFKWELAARFGRLRLALHSVALSSLPSSIASATDR